MSERDPDSDRNPPRGEPVRVLDPLAFLLLAIIVIAGLYIWGSR